MENFTTNEKINILTMLSKNMLGVMFGFCDLKTIGQLRNVVRKFRRIIDSEKDFYIFTEFIKEIRYINIYLEGDFSIFYNLLSENKINSYMSTLSNRLIEKSYTPLQIDDFISLCLSSYLKQNQVREFRLDTTKFHEGAADIQYLKFLFTALKKNSTITKLHFWMSYDTNPYWFILLKELFQSKSTISSLALSIPRVTKYESIKNLCECIKEGSNIRELDLGDGEEVFKNYPDSFNLIIDSLKENKNIKEIFLTAHILDSTRNTLVLSDFLKTTQHVEKIKLNSPHFFDFPNIIFLKNIKLLFEAMTQQNSLIELDLSKNCLGSAILYLSNFLKVNKTLTKLNLTRTDFTNSVEDIAFAEALTINNSLQELNLEHNYLGKERNIDFLSLAIKVNQSIKILNLNDTSIGDDSKSISLLSEAIIGNMTILKLFLQNNTLEEFRKNLEPLCQAIEKNQTIKELYLDGNSLGLNPLNFEDLSLALAKNKTINKLGLSKNNLLQSNNQSFQIFCEMVKINSSLRELDLSDNLNVRDLEVCKPFPEENEINYKLIEEYAENIANFSDAIRINDSISILNFSENLIVKKITKEKLENFFSALQVNKTLKECDLIGRVLNTEDYINHIKRLKSKTKILV